MFRLAALLMAALLLGQVGLPALTSADACCPVDACCPTNDVRRGEDCADPGPDCACCLDRTPVVVVVLTNPAPLLAPAATLEHARESTPSPDASEILHVPRFLPV